MTRSFRIGAALVVLYIAAAVATTSWAPGRLRPLFDGFGSHPGQYNWVNPPKEFAEGNRPPDRAQGRVTFGVEGSSGTSASPEDGQALATLAPGSVPLRPPDSSARIDLRPVDSARLGPLPAGLRAESNAYQVSIVYLPSQTRLASLSQPGTVGLTAVGRNGVLLFSADGKQWQRKPGQPIPRGNGLTGQLTETGYYLVAAKGEPRVTAGAPGSASGGGVLLVLAGVAVPLVLAWLLFSRRRTATAARRRGGALKTRPGTGPAERARPRGPAARGAVKRSTANRGTGKRKGGKGPTTRRR